MSCGEGKIDMRYVDVYELKENTSQVLKALQNEDIVLTKDGQPVAIIKKFTDHSYNKLPREIASELAESDNNTAVQYAAMMKVWGDPKCDIYDEAFRDEHD